MKKERSLPKGFEHTPKGRKVFIKQLLQRKVPPLISVGGLWEAWVRL
ncbi:MAG: hypothetical protein J6K89_04910 [Oscillospiraceae bacterium]|nr:hypothetical protein [Oscillospiraceae bacterium]